MTAGCCRSLEERGYSPDKPLPGEGAALIARCIEDCHRVGMFQPGDPVWVANQIDIPYAYVVYDHGREENVATIRSWLAARDIHLAGRYSEWKYYNSDHAFIAGRDAAETIRKRSEQSRSARATARGSASSPGLSP